MHENMEEDIIDLLKESTTALPKEESLEFVCINIFVNHFTNIFYMVKSVV